MFTYSFIYILSDAQFLNNYCQLFEKNTDYEISQQLLPKRLFLDEFHHLLISYLFLSL